MTSAMFFTLPASCPNDAVDNHKILMSTSPPHLHTDLYARVFLPLLSKPKGLVYGRPIYWDRNVVQSLVFFFSFWHSEEEFERTTFYLPFHWPRAPVWRAHPPVKRVFCPKSTLFLVSRLFYSNYADVLHANFQALVFVNSCIRSLCIYLQDSPPW